MKEIFDVPERGDGPAVWIISNQQWPRAFLRAELIERGFDAIGFEDVAQALAAIGDKRTSRPQLIVVDLRQASVTQIELQTLAHKNLPLIALAGNLNLEAPLLQNISWKAVMKSPFTIGQVCESVANLCVAGENHSA